MVKNQTLTELTSEKGKNMMTRTKDKKAKINATHPGLSTSVSSTTSPVFKKKNTKMTPEM